MRGLRNLLIIFLLFQGTCFAGDPPIELKDEGVSQGRPIFGFDCVGAGISCSKSGTTATLMVAGGGAATAAGADKQMQFNDGGTNLGADQSFLWNKSPNTLSISRDVSQTGSAIVISSDTAATLAVISHDGTASFVGLQLDNSLPAIEGGTGQSTFTKGDILAASSSTALTKLAIGTDGQILSADSSTATGLKWIAAPTGGGAGTPGGANTQVQFNNSSSFGGESSFAWSSSPNTLSISSDAAQNSKALVISSDTTVTVAWISHDGSASFGGSTSGLSTIDKGLTVNNGNGGATTDEFTVNGDTVSNLFKVVVSADMVRVNSVADAKSFIVGGPSAQTIAAAGTITADACGGIKKITASGAVTTNTTNTFTAPASGNTDCFMWIYNSGSQNITLDNNANFKSFGGADVVMTQDDMIGVFSTGSVWVQATVLTHTLSVTMTLAANILFGENTEIQYDQALSADGKYCGLTEVVTAGETVAFGEIVYLKAADSQWYLTDADADATAGAVRIGIAVTSGTDNNTMTILVKGKIRADAKFPTLTVGAPVYISTTAGAVQTAQPSGTDDVIRIVGHANTTDELDFSPSTEYMTHT